MLRRLSRLRWQLTLSHLIAIAVTLICMIAAVFTIGFIGTSQHLIRRRDAATDARTIARIASDLVVRGETAELNTVLRTLADGSLKVLGSPESEGPPWRRIEAGVELQNVAFIAVVGPDGRTLASSNPAGTALVLPADETSRAAIARALAGRQNLDRLVVRREGDGPATLGAYPIRDDQGVPIAAVVVGETASVSGSGSVDLWRTLAIFGVVSAGVLVAASLFALASASLVAYLLSRRLVARLERLGRAADALAAGDLACRVEEGRADEVGQLAHRFNQMAAELQTTLSDLQEERDRVAGLHDARRQLVAGVSHELRTPVATVRGYLESALSRDELDPAALRSDLETMEREVIRLQRLIDDLFTLSRAEVGRLELRLAPTDVSAVVRRLADTVAPLAWGQGRVQVLAELPQQVPPARADADRLEQIVSNLLVNAVRHTPPGGLVAAAVAAEPSAVRVEVRDTGEGIAPSDLPHIFDRFYQGQNGNGGAGLGLALAKELATAMGGSVEAASTPGEGSCFTVRLPRA